MRQTAASCLGLLLLMGLSGCITIPTWQVPDPAACQCLENAWGDGVDCICHSSPIDQPYCDPHYVKKGVYRVAPYGIVQPAESQPPKPATPLPIPLYEDDPVGYLKP
jgi:hypothetical protein